MATDYEREAAQDLIEEGIEAGITAERERIIKILEGIGFRWDGKQQTILLDKRELIELIKGE